ncbi:hypothetical protein [Mycolicibacterium sp. P1-5]|uniref:hypothetical protein n=1 Tax=Mycolicibacterium sp. P1-5 TaxID=2024617 RepID=UPI0011ED41F3|nr:hypothetical protein [Mycolicibacterium sp. P1-5]KAA0110207.1 hypothetical protein CIW47_08405 [Mycolicibacterium sp. P1-5]
MNIDPSDTAVAVIDPQNGVVRGAAAGPRHPTRGDGYQAALVKFAFLAHSVLSTDDVVGAMAVAMEGAP